MIYFMVLNLVGFIEYAKELVMVQALLGYFLGREADRIEAFVQSLGKEKSSTR